MYLANENNLQECCFTVVHLDDDPLELRNFAKILHQNNKNVFFNIISFLNLKEFNAAIPKISKIDFAILDIYLSDDPLYTGISVVSELKKYHPEAIVLMSSNLDDPDSVLQSLRAGADEFVSKKMKTDDVVEKILLVRKSILLKRGINLDESEENIVKVTDKYSGETMCKIARRIPQIVNSAITSVYIEGESGTGKEVVVDLFVDLAKNTPFVKMNCGSISPSLLESELFGYAKGAFTGALLNKPGLIEAASGGWFFLDEVASLSPSAQVALLRVLENQEVTRIGESSARKINVRFIAASNVPLSKSVENGNFRNDLWQRLCETEIILKPLRERREEIPDLITFFCRTMRGGPYKIEETAMNVLCQLPWSEGNVRELRNCLRAMTEHQTQGILSPMGIPERILLKVSDKFFPTYDETATDLKFISIPIKNGLGEYLTYNKMMDLLLKAYIEKLYPNSLNVSKVAKNLGLARSTLQIKLKNIFGKNTK